MLFDPCHSNQKHSGHEDICRAVMETADLTTCWTGLSDSDTCGLQSLILCLSLGTISHLSRARVKAGPPLIYSESAMSNVWSKDYLQRSVIHDSDSQFKGLFL